MNPDIIQNTPKLEDLSNFINELNAKRLEMQQGGNVDSELSVIDEIIANLRSNKITLKEAQDKFQKLTEGRRGDELDIAD